MDFTWSSKQGNPPRQIFPPTDEIKMRDYNGQAGYLTYLGSPASI